MREKQFYITWEKHFICGFSAKSFYINAITCHLVALNFSDSFFFKCNSNYTQTVISLMSVKHRKWCHGRPIPDFPTLWGSRVKLGWRKLPTSTWLSWSTSYMLYDGFPISTFRPPFAMGCLCTRLPLWRDIVYIIRNLTTIRNYVTRRLIRMQIIRFRVVCYVQVWG